MTDYKGSFKHYINYLLLVFFIITPIIFFILPASFFDNGQTICLFTNLSGYHCPGCGLTRAIMHLYHFDVEIAYSYNALSFIILPIIIVWWAINIKRYFKSVYRNKK